MEGGCTNWQKGNWNIQNRARSHEDHCYVTIRTQQSREVGDYALGNFYSCDCGAKVPEETSLEYPTILFRDGYGWTSRNGCNIDVDSSFRNARNMTNPRLIQQLHERPYMGVPYMGRGVGDKCVETELLPGESTMQKRPCNNLSGIYIEQQYTPLIPCIRDTIQEPVHLIPTDSDPSWIRGGQPSRQLIRNLDYLTRCGFSYNGKFWGRS